MRKRSTIIAAASVAAVLAVLVLLLATSDVQRGASLNFEVVNQVAPPIAGSTIQGGEYDLDDHRGDWVVVNFFASWCVGCRIEHPELVAFTERHADGSLHQNGVQLVAVMFGDTEADAREFFAELGGDWPALVEDTGRIAIDYGVTAVPETLLISPNGRVAQKWIGSSGVTADAIDATIAAIEGQG